MDKDMMAKVNEVLNANGKRELSLDELDQVVGGFNVGGKMVTTEADVDWFVYDFVKNYEALAGKDATAEMLLMVIGSARAVEEYRGSGLDGLYNHLCLILDNNGGFH